MYKVFPPSPLILKKTDDHGLNITWLLTGDTWKPGSPVVEIYTKDAQSI